MRPIVAFASLAFASFAGAQPVPANLDDLVKSNPNLPAKVQGAYFAKASGLEGSVLVLNALTHPVRYETLRNGIWMPAALNPAMTSFRPAGPWRFLPVEGRPGKRECKLQAGRKYWFGLSTKTGQIELYELR